VIDASGLLGAPQLAGVVVSPVGLFRSIESNMTVMSGGVVVPGSTGPAIADKPGGKSAAEQRQENVEASAQTFASRLPTAQHGRSRWPASIADTPSVWYARLGEGQFAG